MTAEGVWDNPIVTKVEPLDVFYPAEDYHQNYFVDNPNQGYCRVVIAPKVAKFRQKYLAKLKV
jgi:peptide-methionine (S)-S-oxide reductase